MSIAELEKNFLAEIVGYQDKEWEAPLMELGFLVGRKVQVKFCAPFKGPLAVQIGETLLSMRFSEAQAVLVKIVPNR